jgi:hypothetical protein
MLKMVNTPFSYLVYIFSLIFTGIAHWGEGGGVGTQRPLFRHYKVGSLAGAQLSNDKYKPPVEQKGKSSLNIDVQYEYKL